MCPFLLHLVYSDSMQKKIVIPLVSKKSSYSCITDDFQFMRKENLTFSWNNLLHIVLYLAYHVIFCIIPGDTLGGHLDDMEADWSKPIVSLRCYSTFF